jgi:hypothetical protein
MSLTHTGNPATNDSCIYVDLENILGTERSVESISSAWSALENLLDIHDRDHVVVASGPALAATALFRIPVGRVAYKVRAGVDGADLILIDQFDADWLARRYRRFVIASGDHLFAPLARAAADRGVEVVQVLGRGLPSAELARACHRQERLDLAA